MDRIVFLTNGVGIIGYSYANKKEKEKGKNLKANELGFQIKN